MRPSPAVDASLFENAPPVGMEKRLGLVEPGGLRIGRRVLLLVLVGWVPIMALTVMQTLMSGMTDQIASLIRAIEMHVRYLVAAPLLVYAEALCAPSLSAIVRHFTDSGLVPAHEHTRLQETITSTRHLLESTAAEVAVIGLAYLVMAMTVWSSFDRLPAWQKSAGGLTLSPAGWWHSLISMPLLLILIFGWMWRLALWARLLWQVSRFDLQLVASHVDRAGGLGFLGYSVRAFSTVGLAFAAVAAARSVHGVLQGGDQLLLNVYFNIGWLTFLTVLFTAPLLTFFPRLVKVWRRGMFEYGALATRVGNAFERKWLGHETGGDGNILQQSDFSSAADLYQVISNVNVMRFVPLTLNDVGMLVGIMLLPFIPVVLLMVPLDTILTGIKGLLL